MTQPDYPLAVLPSYELYQVAHIATFLADRLTRLRGATTKAERGAAMDGLAAGRAALERALERRVRSRCRSRSTPRPSLMRGG